MSQPALSNRQVLSILAILVYDPLAEALKLAPPDLGRFFFLRCSEAAVFDTPQRELLPAMQVHGGRADHNLVEFEAHRVAVTRVAPVSLGKGWSL